MRFSVAAFYPFVCLLTNGISTFALNLFAITYAFCIVLKHILSVQECDATMLHSSNVAWFIMLLNYTLTVFHLPLLKSINAAMVMAVSATGIAMNTPVGPKPK